MNPEQLRVEEELDFFKKKSTTASEFKQQQSATKKIQFEKFKTIAVSAFAVVAIGATAVGGNYAWNSHQENKIHEIEASIQKANPSSVLNLIEKEKHLVEKTYVANKLLFNQYAENKEVVEILNIQKDISKRMNSNDSVYKESIKSLNKDFASVETIINASKPNTNIETKKDVFLSGSSVSKFNEWKTLLNSDAHMYADSLIKIGKDTKENLDFLEQTKAEIINTVQQKIQSKDYNLNATQSALASKVSKDLNSDIEELQKVQSELKGTDQANLLTDKDVSEAKEAVGNLQTQALDQIAQDRAKVEAMLATPADKTATPSNSQLANTNTSSNINTGNTTVVHHYHDSNRWGFAEYYLLYNWMAGGSSSTPSAMASYNNNSYNSNMYNSNSSVSTPTKSTVQSSLYQHAASKYDIKNSNSDLNKKLSTNFGNSADNGLANSNKNLSTNFGNSSDNKFNTTPNANKNANPSVSGLSKLNEINAKRASVDELREKILKAHEKAATAKTTFNKVQAEKKIELSKKSEAIKLKNSSTTSSTTGASFTGFKKSPSSSSSLSSTSRSRSSSRRR